MDIPEIGAAPNDEPESRYSRVPPLKRLFDISFAVLLLIPGIPLMAIISVVVLVRDGRPVIYSSPRVNSPAGSFQLFKFRTMDIDRSGPEIGVSGGDKRHRITKLGRFLRKSRLDELPQLFNVLRGDMSFVGPRPPAPRYVRKFPETYSEVLQCRTGITGLATVIFHAHEEWLLRDTKTARQTERIYMRRCVPRKARLDLMYRDNWSLGLDIYLIYLTAGKLLPLPGKRLKRLKAKAKRV
ncbi:lipopolysaccharide/colanic/teichoic acid biosynthesis glycosyltransferase [Aliiruegeria haliotis]|uniref:Lipopolysaccharide/colanic/teichoic acid biosynthesis glycosyltransferase n=1 Tax=Aliiruegeria haliotis TaxID=1280846 RepID=A0A2T0RPE2_9RHOB|nr:sugar transferase [Aliiruegeria haliotis]PRY23012.1 lipopolysaccharide/colanic/teichoic acid biosynthesis glycosyltransferase [Aliiruegeria haliotis]